MDKAGLDLPSSVLSTGSGLLSMLPLITKPVPEAF